MRTRLLFVACSIAAGLHAQPVLDSNDLPQGGTTYVRATAVPPFDAGDLDEGGADLVWDFSTLEVATEAETPYFPMSQASLTTQFVFSGADHFTAFNLPDFGEDFALPISGATVYNEFGSSAYRTIGLGITTDLFDLPVIYDDAEEILPLPLTYGATLSGAQAFEVDLPGVLYYATEGTTDIEVDAWGTLQLPGGSYECVRVKRAFASEDTIALAAAELGFALPREGTVYEWYAAGEGMPVLSVQAVLGVPANWQFKPAPSTVESVPEMALHVYPTVLQSGEPVMVDAEAGHTWVAMDVNGRVLFQGIPDVQAGKAQLNTSGWPAGTVVLMNQKNGRSARIILR